MRSFGVSKTQCEAEAARGPSSDAVAWNIRRIFAIVRGPDIGTPDGVAVTGGLWQVVELPSLPRIFIPNDTVTFDCNCDDDAAFTTFVNVRSTGSVRIHGGDLNSHEAEVLESRPRDDATKDEDPHLDEAIRE